MNLRKNLYPTGTNVLFNPTTGQKPDGPYIVDLTFDVTNTLRAYHDNTADVLELLNNADAVICDNPHLAKFVRQNIREYQTVLHVPYGYSPASRIETDEITVGALNHRPDLQFDNGCESSVAIFETIADEHESILVYGEEIAFLPQGKQSITQDFEEFASRVDILIVPGSSKSYVAMQGILAVMSASTAVITAAIPTLKFLADCDGVARIDTADPLIWKTSVDRLRDNPTLLANYKSANQESLAAVHKAAYAVANAFVE